MQFTPHERVVTYFLAVLYPIKKKEILTTYEAVIWLNWYLHYVHNKYNLNNDETWVIFATLHDIFRLLVNMYLWCWLQELPPLPAPASQKILVWIGLTKKSKPTIKVNREGEFVFL